MKKLTQRRRDAEREIQEAVVKKRIELQWVSFSFMNSL